MAIQRNLLIHLIDSLSIGGAEILLKNSVQLLPEYRHLVVYLQRPETLNDQFPAGTEFICLEHSGWGQVVKTIQKLRKLVKERKPALVHAHLLNSTIIARLAVPRSTPLVGTVHSLYSEDAFKINKKGLWAERLTARRQDALIAVSEYVLRDYLHTIHYKGPAYIVYNFLPHPFFNNRPLKNSTATLKCIAVGTLKEAKNYPYLLQVFEHLKDQPISLDIYGTGSLGKEFQDAITKKKLNVTLKGHATNIQNLLPQYDLFIQASAHEGFGLSVIEAVAAKVPVLISCIPVFKEITNGYAHFFSLDNAAETSAVLLRLSGDPSARNAFVDQAYEFAKNRFSEEAFSHQIKQIYHSLICQKE